MSNVIDVIWPITNAGRIPLHHQYPLLSAISKIVPDVHNSEDFGIHTIRGMHVEPGVLQLIEISALRIRTLVYHLPKLLRLSGKRLDLAGHFIRLGVSRVQPLEPKPDLQSHFVTIKGYMDEGPMYEGLRKQLEADGISSSVTVTVGRRRVLRLKSYTVVGFEVRLTGLTREESIRVQERGLGGRRHLGCGLFTPFSKTSSFKESRT